MIRVMAEGGLFKPVAVCALCDRQIENAQLGAYLWKIDPDRGELLTGETFLLHKGECLRTFEKVNGGRRWWFWEELTRLPGYLAANMAVERTAAGRRAA